MSEISHLFIFKHYYARITTTTMWGKSTPNCEKINWEENGRGETYCVKITNLRFKVISKLSR